MDRGYRLAAGLAAMVVCAGLADARVNADVTMTFDTPVVTGPEAPGVWYVDRFAPAGFTSPVSFDGDNRLQESISSSDFQSDAFYNTQGRAYDLGSGIQSMSIQLYVPSDWATTGDRMAGFWGVATDASSNVDAFPIIEFTSTGGTPEFRGWDSAGSWVDIGLPTGFAYNQFITLTMTLSGGNIVYQVGDLSQSVSAYGATQIASTILEGYNNDASYNIYWDNFHATTVPEPSTMALMGLGAIGLVAHRRLRTRGRSDA